jgi:hypothetical protein
MSNAPGGVQASASQHLTPTEKLLFLFSRWDVVSLLTSAVAALTHQGT